MFERFKLHNCMADLTTVSIQNLAQLNCAFQWWIIHSWYLYKRAQTLHPLPQPSPPRLRPQLNSYCNSASHGPKSAIWYDETSRKIGRFRVDVILFNSPCNKSVYLGAMFHSICTLGRGFARRVSASNSFHSDKSCTGT